MELQAALEAMSTLSGDIRIISDSAYVVNCFNDQWYIKWIKNNFKKGKKEIKNRDIWEPMLELYLDDMDRYEFVWVKGHSGVLGNDKADKLAVDAKLELKIGVRDKCIRTGVDQCLCECHEPLINVLAEHVMFGGPCPGRF